MKERVFCVSLCFTITLVASNPVPSQQTAFKNSVPCQASFSQNNAAQNQAPIQGYFDSSFINEILKSKLFGNPSWQNILDPNTKLCNQNGQDIQRKPTMGATPSVINNYFIVPPELFNIKNNETTAKSKNISKKRKNIHDRKAKQAEPKPIISDNHYETNLKDVEILSNQNDTFFRKGEKKRNKKFEKLVQENIETNIEKEPEAEVRVTKKVRKQNSSNNSVLRLAATPAPIEDSKFDFHKEDVIRTKIKSNGTKRIKKRKKKADDITTTSDTINGSKRVQNLQSSTTDGKKKKIGPKSASQSPKQDNSDIFMKPSDETHLKTAEAPVKNRQENNRSTKRVKENKKTGRLITDKKNKEQAQIVAPVKDDKLENLFPHMYMSDNLNPYGNYPFNFEQFYQPYLRTNNNNGKINQRKQKTKKDSLPNVVSVKVKPKKQKTTTEKPSPAENTGEVESEPNIMVFKPLKNGNNQSEEYTKKHSLPNIVEVKMKPKNHDKTTTIEPSTADATEEAEPEITKSEPNTIFFKSSQDEINPSEQDTEKESLPHAVPIGVKLEPRKQEIISTEKTSNAESKEELKPEITQSESIQNISNPSKITNNQTEQKIENDSLPNTVDVKLKTKKQETITITSTEKESTKPATPLEIESTKPAIPFEKASTKPAIPLITKPTKDEVDDEKSYQYQKKEEVTIPKSVYHKQDFNVPKANLQMPPTVIEDLHEYITPELENNDLVSNIHKNGIINEYYPIFNDEFRYESDEHYVFKELEDNRHFYTTDRGFEEYFNGERRKYDKNENYQRQNLEDRFNFRRAFKSTGRDERNETKHHNEDKKIYELNYHEKVSEKEKSVEDQFQIPPLLDNPDFKTTKIERGPSKANVKNYESEEPVYREFVKQSSDFKTFSDQEPIQYSRILNLDTEETDKISTTITPMNDRIETVYAKTRVVKYGAAKDQAEDDTLSVPKFENGKGTFYSDGHTTYVVAKSLGKPEDYFW